MQNKESITPEIANIKNAVDKLGGIAEKHGLVFSVAEIDTPMLILQKDENTAIGFTQGQGNAMKMQVKLLKKTGNFPREEYNMYFKSAVNEIAYTCVMHGIRLGVIQDFVTGKYSPLFIDIKNKKSYSIRSRSNDPKLFDLVLVNMN